MILVVAQAIHMLTKKETVITSICDGRHRSDSYHYLLGAADFRSRHLTPEERQKVLDQVREKLEPEFDFIHEEDPLHFHGEWDNNEAGSESSRIILQRRLEQAQSDLIESILDPQEP